MTANANLKNLRVGIIGAGQIVEDAHLPILKNFPNVNIAWITDINQARADFLAKMYRVPTLPPKNALEEIPELDVCLLAIPIGTRQTYLEACAEANIAVYTEKPFARTTQEHQALTALFPSYALAAGFQRRFYRSSILLRQIISSEIFGPVQEITFNQGSYELKSGGANRFITDPLLSGGGTIIESAIHGFDQIVFATQADAANVNEAKAIIRNHIDYETIASTTLLIKQQAVPVNACVTRLRNLQQGFVFTFETAVVQFGLSIESPLHVYSRHSQTSPHFELTKADVQIDYASTINQAFYLFWDSFFHAINTQQTNATSAITSLLTTAWVEAIYKEIAL